MCMGHGNQSNSIEGNLPNDDAGSDSQGSPQGVVVQIVHNDNTLQSLRVDAEALEQHSRCVTAVHLPCTYSTEHLVAAAVAQLVGCGENTQGQGGKLIPLAW